MIPVALTIAGSDPSGGAGLQADLKTFHQHNVYGTSIVTLLTVQNTQSVSAIEILDSNFVLAQLDAVLDDIPPQAAKVGALGNIANIKALAERVKSFSFPLVLDPVMVSKHGHSLIDDDAVKMLRAAVIDGADHTSILEYWNAFSSALDEAQPELAQRFTDICDSHADYVWDLGTK